MTAEDLCMEFEGLCLEAYKCPAGKWTIGYGHTPAEPGQVINQGQAFALLIEDCKRARTFVRQLVNSRINQNQIEALTSFTFNLGPGNLKSSTLLKKVNANPDDPAIAAEFRKWVKADFKVLPGLVKRREAEIKLYFT